MKFKTKEAFVKWLLEKYNLTEATRTDASYQEITEEIREALNAWDGRPATRHGGALYIAYTFPDRVIAYSYEGMEADCEGWEIPYTKGEGDDSYTFGTPVAVEKVVTYEPIPAGDVEPVTEEAVIEALKNLAPLGEGERLPTPTHASAPTTPAPTPTPTPTPPSTPPTTPPALVESVGAKKKGKLLEITESHLELAESKPGDPPGGKRIKAIGITADLLNSNKRVYPRAVLAEAIERLNGKLTESASKGRLVLTGEAEHPSDKGKRQDILETVFRWDSIQLNELNQVLLEGTIIPTAKGKDLITLAEFGVPIKLSQRAVGESESVTAGDLNYDRVTYVEIKGYDAVAQPSDLSAGLIESIQQLTDADNPQTLADTPQTINEGDQEMTLEQILALLKEKPEMLEAVMSRIGLEDKKALATKLNTSPEMLATRLEEAVAAKKELDELKRKQAIEEAIRASTKDLPYGDLNSSFIENVRAANPATAEDVSPLVEAKLKEWDIIVSKMRIASMGGRGGSLQMLGPVFERETGQPEYTKVAFTLNESMVNAGTAKRHDLRKAERGQIPGTGSLLFANQILKQYDQRFRNELIAESKRFEEAEQTTDLNLPYTVMRTVIEQAYPELVAANIFDFGVAQSSPDRLYYEQYAGETGVVVAVTSETVASIWDTWVQLAQKRLVPGTVTITNSGASTTYVEGTDYAIDHGDGRIYALSGGTITSGQSLKANYTYDAFRKGEMAEIERAKNTLSSKTLDIAADRLATQISNEAIVFSRSQMGYDAVGRTLSNLMRLVRRKIDQDILYEAISACLMQANNSGGTWIAASDSLDALTLKMGVTKGKIYSRFYTPTAFIMSNTNAERLSNWSGFTRLGWDNAMLNAAGFAGSVKGLPIFATPEFSDGYILAVNRELVQHRVFSPMQIKGPYPSYSNGKLVAADQYYIEEYNGTDSTVPQKGAYMKVT